MRGLKHLLIGAASLAALGISTAGQGADAPASPYFQVDLSKHVTHSLFEPMLKAQGSDLSNLAASVPPNETPRKTMKGVPFRLDGVVLVGPGESSNGLTGEPAPVVKKVEGIPVGRKAEKLYFLHATHWHGDEKTKIGAYLIHYADKSQEEIPIRYGIEVRDWWNFGPDKDQGVSNGVIAWTGTCEAATRNDVKLRLFMLTWQNPHPEREIESLDVVTGDQKGGPGACTPFLVALSGQ
jgi:hypothetical protein